MQIACPQCSAQYDLDARLLPPGGVPVQCTRCRFVFKATPSGVPAPPPAPEPAAAPEAGASALNSTLLFGQSASTARTEPEFPAQTGAPPPSTTQPFGPLPPDFFRLGTPPFGTPAARSSTSETMQAFGGLPPPAASTPARSQTQIFGAGELEGLATQAEEASAKPTVSLPPEPSVPRAPRGQRGPSMPAGLPPELLSGKPSRAVPPRPSEPPRKGGLLLTLGLLGVLGVTAALAYPVWRKRANELPAEVVTFREEAMSLLRRDDTASREQAISLLRQLVARHPNLTEARADLALALSLELDDVLLDNQRLQAAEARLDRRIRVMSETKTPADWVIRINAMNDELVGLLKEREPLGVRIQELLSETTELQRILRVVPKEESPSDILARARAQAVHAGVRASDDALTLAARLGALEAPPQHWFAVARAEHALNEANPSQSRLGEVASALEHVREKDRTFLRAYVLGARVAMKLGDPHTAQGLLDEVVTLNPHHALARKLHAWSKALEAELAPSP